MRGNNGPKHFLLRDDLTACAEHVSSIVRHAPRQDHRYSLYVADDGGIRVVRHGDPRQNHRPEAERIGVYDKTARVERIEDDLLVKKRELIAAMKKSR